MKKMFLVLFVAAFFLSCTKEDVRGSISVNRGVTLDPNGKSTSSTQYANGDAGIGADPFGKR